MPTSKTLTLSFNDQQKLQPPNFPTNLRNYVFGNCREHHAFLFIPFNLPYPLHGALQIIHTSICWSQTWSTHQNRSTSNFFMYNLCANPRTFPRHRHTVQWPNSSPSALNWLMVCDMEWGEQEEGTGLGAMQYFDCSWLRSWTVPVQEFSGRSITQVVTFISLDFYRKPLYENVRMPHHTLQHSHQVCSLYCSHCLKNWNFRQCWKDCLFIYSPAYTGIQKTIFSSSYFQEKVLRVPRRQNQRII